MSLISGEVAEDARIVIYDIETDTIVVDEEIGAGAYGYTGLTADEKIITATHSGTDEVIAYGKVFPVEESI